MKVTMVKCILGWDEAKHPFVGSGGFSKLSEIRRVLANLGVDIVAPVMIDNHESASVRDALRDECKEMPMRDVIPDVLLDAKVADVGGALLAGFFTGMAARSIGNLVTEAAMKVTCTRCGRPFIDHPKGGDEKCVKFEAPTFKSPEDHVEPTRRTETEGLTLPGWWCLCEKTDQSRGIFNGSGKEQRTHCRCCGAPRDSIVSR